MQRSSEITSRSIGNPLELLEEFVAAHDWDFHRGNDELTARLSGAWGDLQLHFVWSADMGTLQFFCRADLHVPPHRRAAVHELLALANARLWLGHFDLTDDARALVFRHALPLRGASSIVLEQCEDLVDAAVAECERYYPAFQYVIWGGRSAANAIAAAVIEPEGQA
jgi:hypothetical protein